MSMMRLSKIPEDIREYIIKKQCEIKAKKIAGQFSQESTIYTLIREHKQLTKK